MSRFVALPVGQGDSFYLQTDGKSILVDGGRSRHHFSSLLKQHVGTGQLDIVVCTHNDADHVEGLVGLLEELPCSIGEVWLPGSWAFRFHDLAQDPQRFYAELWEQISHTNVESLAEVYQHIPAAVLENSVEPTASRAESPTGENASDWFLQDSDDESILWRRTPLPSQSIWAFLDLIARRDGIAKLVSESINAAERILAVAKAAVHAGATIRLFSRDLYRKSGSPSGGIPGVLEPLNSVECLPWRQRIGALEWVALTTENRESLVFLSPETSEGTAVLFTADSDLQFTFPPSSPKKIILATAPHHGAEANARAYSAVDRWLGAPHSAIWIRCDGRYRRRPGGSYKRQSRKACTLCNSPSSSKAPVKFHTAAGSWQRTKGTRLCTCL